MYVFKPLPNKEEMLKFIEIIGMNIPCELEGITIDKKLNIIRKKAARQINVMYQFKGIFHIKEKQIIYNMFILSNFTYCLIIWHFCRKNMHKNVCS